MLNLNKKREIRNRVNAEWAEKYNFTKKKGLLIYKCDICNKELSNFGCLYNHARKHEKRYNND